MKTTMNIETRYRGFSVKYLGATNTLGARIKIIDPRFNRSVTLSRDYAVESTNQAIQYLESIGIVIDSLVLMDRDSMLLTTDFQSQLIA